MSLGGTEINAYLMAREQSLEHEVHALFPYAWEPQPSARYSYDGLKLWTLPLPPPPPVRKLWDPLVPDPEREARALELLDRIAPDVVHVHHLQDIPIRVAEVAKKVAFTIRDYWYGCARGTLTTDRGDVCDGPDASHSNCARCWLAKSGLPTIPTFGILPRSLQERAGRFRELLNRARVAFAPSKFLMEKHARFGVRAEVLRYLQNGVERPREFRREPSDRVRFGFLGSLTPEKGVHVAVEAAERAGVELHVFGTFDPERIEYHASLRNRARFHGKVENPFDAFARIDCLLVPSLWYENCPGVILQARSTRTAVIASDFGALRELVRAGVDGLLAAPGDVDSWFEAIRRASDPAEARRWGEAGPMPLSIEDHTKLVLEAYA